MLLDRIDIDSHGPLARIGVGPFSQQLNVVHTAAGSGKTALVRFLRDSLTGTTPAYGGMAKSSGRVVWAAADGLYHCRREPDGTSQGRRFVEFESRLGGYNADRFNRPSVVIDLPASIVDGIVTDTVMSSVRRVVHAVIESGLDRNGNAAGLEQRSAQQTRQTEINTLRAEIVRLRDQLRREGHLDGASVNETQIRDRLAALTLEIGAIDSRRQYARQTDAAMHKRRRDRDAMTHAVAEVDRLRRQETDLRSRITSLENSLNRLESQTRREDNLASITQIARKRVNWIDQQVNSLRNVLAEIRSLGDQWFNGRSTAGTDWRLLSDSISLDSPRDPASVTAQTAAQIAVPLSREELLVADRGWLAGRTIEGGFADGQSLGLSGYPIVAAEIEGRLDGVCRSVDRLVGRLEAEQQHWLAADQTAEEIFGEAMTETEQAIRRARRRSEPQFESNADGGADDLVLGTRVPGHSAASPDSGWVDDSVRRQRIDSLHRAERRRRLDDLADSESSDEGTEDAILATMRAMGTALHSISRRLRGLRVNQGSLILPLVEQADCLRRCERELVSTLVRLVNHRAALVRRVSKATAPSENPNLELILPGNGQSGDWAEQADHSELVTQNASRLVTDVRTDAELTWTIDDNLLTHPASVYAHTRQVREAARRRLENERGELVVQLRQSIEQMNQKLSLAEQLRSKLRALPLVQADEQDDEVLRGRVEAEIQRLHRLLAAVPSNSVTLTRYRQSITRLKALEADLAAAGTVPHSPLAALASSYLQRLSGGRLQTVDWSETVDSASGRLRIEAMIDARGEEHYSDSDRFLATLAIRLAASDELAHRGRPLPLIIETPAELTAGSIGLGRTEVLGYDSTISAEQATTSPLRTIVAVLAEAATRGRQMVLLTHDRLLADTVVQFGGRGYGLNGTTYFAQPSLRNVASVSVAPIHSEARAWREASQKVSGDANRDFDIHWREAHGIDAPPTSDSLYRSVFDVAATGDDLHESKTPTATHRSHQTSGTNGNGHAGSSAADFSDPIEARRDVVAFPSLDKRGNDSAAERNGRGGAPSNPFFLTGDSPIEQSPSIDALAAARMRQLGLLSISQLLSSSPQELAEKVQMPDVNAATIRRWQSECRLVCGVRGLRGFDARVLVGCGIVHPREIAEVEPAELVEKVEAFLATDRGASILRTGTSHEVSRLTEWLAESRQPVASVPSVATSHHHSNAPGAPQKSAQVAAAAVSRSHLQSRPPRSTVVRTDQTPSNRGAVAARSAAPVSNSRTSSFTAATTQVAKGGDKELKFFLDRQSPVVDAPSIGPRMAERLQAVKIITVDDLLKANPSSIAAELKIKRIDEAIVRSWQQQAKLVCRVPMLRGHDAQLLVAAGITEPERLAQCDPKWLLTQIEPITQSREGQSIIRGGSAPDLAEVTDWVRFAQSKRELKAA